MTYDVFLSFRGEDTRNNFTRSLYAALVGEGIKTFMDDEELKVGESISAALENEIKGSKIAIIIFSKNYANSRWCLEELAQIMECWEKPGQIRVFPVFLTGVDPLDVQHQKGSFGEPFGELEECFGREMVERWRSAMRAAAKLRGLNSNDVPDENPNPLSKGSGGEAAAPRWPTGARVIKMGTCTPSEKVFSGLIDLNSEFQLELYGSMRSHSVVPSSSTSRWNYDVFLNYEEETERTNFGSNLSAVLERAKIKLFKHDENLKRGEQRIISSALMKGIEESRFAIVIFSRNYASSRRCLEELAFIIECKKELIVQKVFPVYLEGVDGSDVRRQKGCFGEPFILHQECFDLDMDRWRSALKVAGDLRGWNLKDYRDEEELIQKILKEVMAALNEMPNTEAVTMSMAQFNFFVAGMRRAQWSQSFITNVKSATCKECGAICSLFTSKNGRNAGKMYYKCPHGCLFFLWLEHLRMCNCGRGLCKVRKSKKDTSKGQSFWCCPYSTGVRNRGCGMFEWIKDDLSLLAGTT